MAGAPRLAIFMRSLPIAAAIAALLVLRAAPAYAGDPIMPLSDVHAGMQCTGYSVIQGTDISSFNVTVLDVAGGEATAGEGARILIQVSGPAVDATGLGPGFSGSPIYCPDAAGVQRVIGAISESVNEYGGKVAFATPIEQILGTPVDVPGKPAAASTRRLLSQAKPLATPLTFSGLSAPVANALEAAGAKAGRPVLTTPRRTARFVPAADAPARARRWRSATRTVTCASASIGTVAYVDGDKVWAFGHQLDDLGRRALLLQDAYVFRIVNNPLQIGSTVGSTYKLASAGHDVGTLTSDGNNAVAGRLGVLPHTVPIKVIVHDEDAKTQQVVDTNAADEAAVDLPSGGSWTSAIAPLAVAQGATERARQHARPRHRHDVRADHAERDQVAAALLQPLRLDRPGAGGRRQRRKRADHHRGGRHRRRAGDDRRLHGQAAARDRRDRAT